MAKKAQQLTLGLIITDPQSYRLQQQRKSRKCLSCSSTFDSEGPGNRICCQCKGHEVFSSIPDYSISASF